MRITIHKIQYRFGHDRTKRKSYPNIQCSSQQLLQIVYTFPACFNGTNGMEC